LSELMSLDLAAAARQTSSQHRVQRIKKGFNMSVGAKGAGSDWSILVDRWTIIGVALIAFALILALLWLGYDGVRVAGAAVALLSSVVLAAMARPILLAVVMMGRNRAERRDLATRLERLERDHGLRF
jgi:hypothetical protein